MFLKPEVTTIIELTSRSGYYKDNCRSDVKKSSCFANTMVHCCVENESALRTVWASWNKSKNGSSVEHYVYFYMVSNAGKTVAE